MAESADNREFGAEEIEFQWMIANARRLALDWRQHLI
jgi:hypothetical protein